MSRRQKLIDKMRSTPGSIRFTQVVALLKHQGFVLINSRGSHRTYHHEDGRLITIVQPHGRRKTCHPDDIQKLMGLLEL